MGRRRYGIRPRLRPAAFFVAGLFGAAIGTAWDRLHAWTGAIDYADGTPGQPWWVPPAFGLAFAAGVVAIVRLGDPAPVRRTPAALLAETLWVSGIYGITAVLHQREGLAALAVAVLLLARGRSMRRAVAANPVPALLLVTVGPLVEAVLIAGDLFRYSPATLGEIPLWLPLLYAGAVPFAVRLGETALLWFGARRRVEPVDEGQAR